MEHKETKAATHNFKVTQGVYVGVLMSPAEVSAATRGREGEGEGDLYRGLRRWTLCGDVSPALLEVLRVARMKFGSNERISAFTAPSGLHYAVFTHQLAVFQHRYVVPLFDSVVVRCMQEVVQGGGLGYCLAGENDQAIVWPSVAGAREVMPIAALCGGVADGQEEQALEEYSRMLRELCEPQRVPSLLPGVAVQYASVSAIAPLDLMERMTQRFGVGS